MKKHSTRPAPIDRHNTIFDPKIIMIGISVHQSLFSGGSIDWKQGLTVSRT